MVYLIRAALWAAILLIAAALNAYGQGGLTIQPEYDPHAPIVAGCDCIIPQNAQSQFSWRYDAGTKALEGADARKLYVWAPPGEHWVECTVMIQTYREITVWVPDEANPNDISKAKVQKVKIAEGFTVNHYDATFKVRGTPLPPGPVPPGPVPPGPIPPPGPTPTGLAAQVQTWLKAVPAAQYSKAKALAIADNYLSIGSQGGDPARNSGWDLQAFTTRTKELNQQTLSTAEIAAWSPAFFKPLAEAQAKLFAERGLTTTDKAGLSKIWTETGEAIKAGAP